MKARAALVALAVLGVVVGMLARTAPYVVVTGGPTPPLLVSGAAVIDSQPGRYVVLTVDARSVSYLGALRAVLSGDELRHRGRSGGQDPVSQWQDAERTAAGLSVSFAADDGAAPGFTGLRVTSLRPGSAADAGVRVGDVLLSIDGAPLRSAGQLRTALSNGGDHELMLRRDDATVVVLLPTGVAGLTVIETYQTPSLQPGVVGVGGSSAGLLLSIAYYDALTEGALTGNDVVAATGVVAADGSVMPVEGLPQKLEAAAAAGVTVVLYPRLNTSGLPEQIPAGLTLVPVANVAEAIDALCARGGVAPRCAQR